MGESARGNRCGTRPLVEFLEGRELLSYTNPIAQNPPFKYDLSHDYAAPQSGDVTLTVTRTAEQSNRPLTFQVRSTTLSDEPLTRSPNGRRDFARRRNAPIAGVTIGSRVTRDLRSTGKDPSSLLMAPIDGTYRFAAGQTSMTIPVRLNPNYVPTGKTMLSMNAFTARWKPHYWPTQYLKIVSTPAQVPPDIVSLHFTEQSITLTFNEDMNLQSIENVNNYNIQGSGSYNNSFMTQTVTLASAHYDAATRTAILMTNEPLIMESYTFFAADSYWSGPNPQQLGILQSKAPTDLDGNPVTGIIGFSRNNPPGTFARIFA